MRFDRDDFVLLVIAAALWAVIIWAILGSHADAAEWPQEMPPPKFDPQLWEAAAAAMEGTYAPPECYQRRDYALASVCITEHEWRRQHAEKKEEAK